MYSLVASPRGVPEVIREEADDNEEKGGDGGVAVDGFGVWLTAHFDPLVARARALQSETAKHNEKWQKALLDQKKTSAAAKRLELEGGVGVASVARSEYHEAVHSLRRELETSHGVYETGRTNPVVLLRFTDNSPIIPR